MKQFDLWLYTNNQTSLSASSHKDKWHAMWSSKFFSSKKKTDFLLFCLSPAKVNVWSPLKISPVHTTVELNWIPTTAWLTHSSSSLEQRPHWLPLVGGLELRPALEPSAHIDSTQRSQGASPRFLPVFVLSMAIKWQDHHFTGLCHLAWNRPAYTF